MPIYPSLRHTLTIVLPGRNLKSPLVILATLIGFTLIVDLFVQYISSIAGEVSGRNAFNWIASVWLFLFIVIYCSGIACRLEKIGYPFLVLVPIPPKWRILIHLCEHLMVGLLFFVIPLVVLISIQRIPETFLAVGFIFFLGIMIRGILCFLLEYKMAYDGMNSKSSLTVLPIVTLFFFMGLALFTYGDFRNHFYPSPFWLIITLCFSLVSICMALEAPKIRIRQYEEETKKKVTGDWTSVSKVSLQSMNGPTSQLFDESMFSRYGGVTWRIWVSILRHDIPWQMMFVGSTILGVVLADIGMKLIGIQDNGIAMIASIILFISVFEHSPLRNEIHLLQTHPVNPHQLIRGVIPYFILIIFLFYEFFFSKNPLHDGIWEMLAIVDITLFVMLLVVTGCSPCDPDPFPKRTRCTLGEVEALTIYFIGLGILFLVHWLECDSWALRLIVIPVLYWAICWMWKRY